MHEKELHDLALKLLKAKHLESEAKCDRIKLEDLIAALVTTPEQGQKTVKLEDGSKLTVKRGLIYKANVRDIRDVFRGPSCNDSYKDMYVPIKKTVKEELDVKGYEWYRKNFPQIFQELSEFVTVTPKKTSVAITGPAN